MKKYAGRRKKKLRGTGSGAAAFTPADARLTGDTLIFFPSLGSAYWIYIYNAENKKGLSVFFTIYSRLVHKLSTFLTTVVDKNDTPLLSLLKYSCRYNVRINTKISVKSL